MFPAAGLFLASGFGFLEPPDDLRFTKSFPLHEESSWVVGPENALSKWTVLWGEGHIVSSAVSGSAGYSFCKLLAFTWLDCHGGENF
jgi:hypothetical protein